MWIHEQNECVLVCRCAQSGKLWIGYLIFLRLLQRERESRADENQRNLSKPSTVLICEYSSQQSWPSIVSIATLLKWWLSIDEIQQVTEKQFSQRSQYWVHTQVALHLRDGHWPLRFLLSYSFQRNTRTEEILAYPTRNLKCQKELKQ